MGALSELYFKKDVLEKMVEVLNVKGEKGISITISQNDETNDYGQNVSAWVAQTKEQQEAKKPKFYVGNGKVFWISDGGVKKAVKVEKANQSTIPPLNSATSDSDTFPF